eukprot:CAMPEP_0168452548 /NCGR_PEP_ID=MMETSP0228-20121227/49218_1 /TAXON_ID=133427 /ORGANISM="Protoceratium reticulatum, Strain CCCM 535 (=CCMP 1889)" /LENGTH=48 /DNA_ID= /DNA_START= /DNA_END= /DNA_ORIENTATION=
MRGSKGGLLRKPKSKLPTAVGGSEAQEKQGLALQGSAQGGDRQSLPRL